MRNTSLLYLIEILHQTTTLNPSYVFSNGCILSKFYIKPQHMVDECREIIVVSYRNSTSNHNNFSPLSKSEGVVSYRNSTSNHNYLALIACKASVVSYRNSTSNHNNIPIPKSTPQVVSYRNSTSNHNSLARWYLSVALYLIEILHQTTTVAGKYTPLVSCILSKFYIKPQLPPSVARMPLCCILSKFYIKPQRRASY